MNFKHGQRVRLRGKHTVGIVEKKLSSLDDVYVVLIEHVSSPEEKLVRGADLEALAEADHHKSDHQKTA